jgi:hypothetical protein
LPIYLIGGRAASPRLADNRRSDTSIGASGLFYAVGKKHQSFPEPPIGG